MTLLEITANRLKPKSAIFILLALLGGLSEPLYSKVPKAKLLDSNQFVKKSPLKRDGVVFSPVSFKTIRFLRNKKVEIELAGTIARDYELFLNDTKIPVTQGRFETVVNLAPSKGKYELKIIRPGNSETIYPFKIKRIKKIPAPLRLRIRSAKSKAIIKEKVFTGTYPSKNWLRFVWLTESTKKLPVENKIAQIKDQPVPQGLPDREPTAQTEKIQENSDVLKMRDPVGLQIDQGLGFFSLKQSGKSVKSSNVDSSNWIANIKLRRKVSESNFWEIMGSSFLMPLSVNGTKTGPRLFKLDAGFGGSYPLSERMFFVPSLGFRYQTISTSESIGYRNIIGGRLTLAHSRSFDGLQTLHTAICLAVFGNERYQFNLDNREFGLRISMEWPLNSDLVTSVHLGGEWQTQTLKLKDINLASLFYSGFLGVLF